MRHPVLDKQKRSVFCKDTLGFPTGPGLDYTEWKAQVNNQNIFIMLTLSLLFAAFGFANCYIPDYFNQFGSAGDDINNGMDYCVTSGECRTLLGARSAMLLMCEMT
jgi:hypothetical protein